MAFVSGLMDFATYGGAGISGWIFGVTVKYFGYASMYISWAVISVISAVPLSCTVIRKQKNEGEKLCGLINLCRMRRQ